MKIEPVLPKHLMSLVFDWYIKNDNAKKPIYSPTYGDSKNIGLITIFFGEREALLAPAKIYHDKLDKQHIIHNFYITPKMFHVYTIFKIKEAKRDFLKIVELIKNK
jgi:acetyl esterase/lipase